MGREYHVSPTGNDQNSGSAEQPFRTISKAAKIAAHSDTVTVHAGIYREWVRPEQGGHSNVSRITYQAAPGEKVIIKGSEVVSHWTALEGGIWKAEVSNEIFGEYNPYTEKVDGDWLLRPAEPFLHTGEVYLDGKALREVFDVEQVKQTESSWHAEVLEQTTVIYANFKAVDPNAALTEINVRKCCFYPEKIGLNYITVRGFEMAQAACPWGPPTAEQFGMLGVHWSKGWVIENNILHDAKCSAVSLGKEVSTGDNLYSKYRRKTGHRHQVEAVFCALKAGWSKETIGSHIVRNNTIYNCGQNGIVGHMGGAFSEIYGNHIYNIGNKEEFFGWEIAGIKFHAAVDTQIHDNYIHDCSPFGIWLDWQAQGVRVSRNLFARNGGSEGFDDLFIEVSHGPCLVDNNIFASEHNLRLVSQGGAFVHNLFFGANLPGKELKRATPYHYSHSTDVAGYTPVYGNDIRYYQNMFAGKAEETELYYNGTAIYNGSPTSLKEYIAEGLKKGRDINYNDLIQPVYINGNCYFNGVKAFEKEENNLVSGFDLNPQIIEADGKVYLEIDIPEELYNVPTVIMCTENLEPPRVAEQPYENPDGTPLAVNCDYAGQKRKDAPMPGPFEQLKNGKQKILLWPKG